MDVQVKGRNMGKKENRQLIGLRMRASEIKRRRPPEPEPELEPEPGEGEAEPPGEEIVEADTLVPAEVITSSSRPRKWK